MKRIYTFCLLMAFAGTACSYSDVDDNAGNKQFINGDGTCDSVEKGFYCRNGQSLQLKYSNSACSENYECLSGHCYNKQCLCTANTDCEGSNYCDQYTHLCLKKSTGDACTQDSECSSGHCVNNQCSGCSVANDCSANQVCDDGTCRDVVACPADKSMKCFVAMELFPNEYWYGGNADNFLLENDYLGTTFTPSLPRIFISHCNYGYTDDVYEKNPLFSSQKAARDESTCFWITANRSIPFEFTMNKETRWKEHNFELAFSLDNSPLALASTVNDKTLPADYFELNMAPGYSAAFNDVVGKPDEVNPMSIDWDITSNISTASFPLSEEREIFSRYELKNCKDTQYADDLQACSENHAYKIYIGFRNHREKETQLRCDEVYINEFNESCLDKYNNSGYVLANDQSCCVACSSPLNEILYDSRFPNKGYLKTEETCPSVKILLKRLRVYVEVENSDISDRK